MLARHINLDEVNGRLTEAIDQNDLDLNGVRDGKNVHLEHFLDLEGEVTRVNGHFARLRDALVVDVEDGIRLKVSNLILSRPFVGFEILVGRRSVVIFQVQQLINLAILHLRVHLELHIC